MCVGPDGSEGVLFEVKIYAREPWHRTALRVVVRRVTRGGPMGFKKLSDHLISMSLAAGLAACAGSQPVPDAQANKADQKPKALGHDEEAWRQNRRDDLKAIPASYQSSSK